ncbi:MAG: hypothetical protein D6799_04905 [Bacteroidetes bacterium]|nr:MAG: hypothetical protein D6799_04905 [Bacteroidota bacterium]
MKRWYLNTLLTSLIFWGFHFSYVAQNYGNEWIVYSQNYWKFPIYKQGLYRIDSTTLANAGFPLQNIDARNIQIFLYGEEQYIYIKGEQDGVLNSNDYIEFYADVKPYLLDSLLYSNITSLPNPYIGVCSGGPGKADTVYAFITYNTSVSNKRLNIETDTSFSSYTPENFVYTEQISTTKNNYNYIPQYTSSGLSDARYTRGEGWGYYLGRGNSFTFWNTSFANLYTSQNLPVYSKFSFSGNGIDFMMTQDHHVRLKWSDGSAINVVLWDSVFQGWEHFTKSFTVSANSLNASVKPYIELVADAYTSTNSNIALNGHYIYVKYPSNNNMMYQSKSILYVNDNLSQPKTFLYLNNINGGSNNEIVFYDLTNHKRIENQFILNTLKVLIPNSGSEKRCFFTAVSEIINVSQIRKINNGTGTFTDYSLPKDSAFVIITHTSLLSSANQYKAYRQSASGGNYQVILADVEELYEQFAYGTPKHPQAIRHFCKYLIDKMPSPPRYLLLIGKGITYEYLNQNYSLDQNLVPTMGWPPSDWLLTARLHTNNDLEPEIPTGRISALNNTQVLNYLNKVQQFENPELASWKKQAIHFAGGINASEQSAFLGYMNNLKNIFEDTLMGGKVIATFKKTSSAPVQTNVSDSVKLLINNGVGLIGYFGHGSPASFDIAIENVNDYNNAGKYPVFLVNGCYAGGIYFPNNFSVSENWIFANQKGAIDFIASASLGLAGHLYNYSYNFYKNLCYFTYGKGIGNHIQKVAQTVALSSDIYAQINAMDISLHGDPSIKLWSGNKPDYVITNADVTFDTQTYPDSIGIIINVKNSGKAINDSFFVKITRVFPNNDTSIILKRVKAPYSQSSYVFYTYTDFSKAGGINKFSVYIDSYFEISELNENNNSTLGTVDLFIRSGDIIPVFPYKYAIVPKTPTIVLKASTIDPLIQNTAWRFQLDTTDQFTHPIQQAVIYSPGGVVEWQVSLPFKDSTVYYWRVSKDSVSPSDKFNWRESSFQTISNKRGWGQAHYFQFKNNTYQYVRYNRPQRNFEFANNKINIFCRNGFLGPLSFDQVIYAINGGVRHIWSCTPDGWTVAVFDSISGNPWASTLPNYSNPSPQTGMYGNCHCDGARPLYAFDFGNGYCGSLPNWQQDMANFILNTVPNGNYVLVYSPKFVPTYTLIPQFYTALQSIGSANIINYNDTLPMIIFGKKGAPVGTANEVIAPNAQTPITLSDTFSTKWNSGYILSEIIGPAFKWKSLHWRVASLDNPKTDTTILKLIGIKLNGQKDTLATFTEDSLDVLDLENYADASVYPNLQLIAYMKDNVNHTAPQLKRWQVLYDEVPECAINPKKAFYLKNDTIQQGDNFVIAYAIENIGHVPFNDSLLITYYLEKNNVKTILPSKLKAKPFYPAAIIIDTLSINTLTLSQMNTLWIDVNPPGAPKYQLEQYHFNNVLSLDFTTSKDIINPLLDVTFDGVRILNGDIVSAKPHIVISVLDENKYLLLNDTSNIRVYIKKDNEAERQLFFAKDLIFYPASSSNKNKCRVEYKPTLADGKYTLRVQATDKSNNISGWNDYRITFEVINKPSITQLLNYPNPFSTSTRFVFTLTGSEIPENIDIQIMTITGKVVKTIRKEDLGYIHIGRNITEYAWDGTDDFGDKLANGVYLYKVNVRLNGNKVELRQTEADKYFQKEIGKLVILR